MADRECYMPEYSGCCCTCAHRYNDYSHPLVDGKSILNRRGYICGNPELGYTSGWTEHGMCECYSPRQNRPEARFAAEIWDRLYGTDAEAARQSVPSPTTEQEESHG